MALLPIEDLTGQDSSELGAALRLGLWDALQGQATTQVVLVGHRRDVPELRPVWRLEGYADARGYHLRLNGEPVECSGKLKQCLGPVLAAVSQRTKLQPRAPLPPAVLEVLAGPSGNSAGALEEAVKEAPLASAPWLALAGERQRAQGEAAAVAVLESAPTGKMAALDAGRIRLRLAEYKRDVTAAGDAWITLADAAPADLDVQERASLAFARKRDFRSAVAVLERILVLSPQAPVANRAAYFAAFAGERERAEALADRAVHMAPGDARFVDTRGDVAYYFGDYGTAAARFIEAGTDPGFLNGLAIWKAAESYRLAGESRKADETLARYLTARQRAGARSLGLLEAVWAWRSRQDAVAEEKLLTAAESLDRGRALFFLALASLEQGNPQRATVVLNSMDPASIEAGFLAALLRDGPVPAALPYPPAAVEALRAYLQKDADTAAKAMELARGQLDPLTEGQWRKLDDRIHGRTPERALPAPPEDWLAMLLR